MSGKLVFTKQAQKDAKKLAASGLKNKAQKLLGLKPRKPQNVTLSSVSHIEKGLQR